MASCTCHVICGTKQFRLERIVRPRSSALLFQALHANCTRRPCDLHFVTATVRNSHPWHVRIVVVVPVLRLLPDLPIDKFDQGVTFPAIEFTINLRLDHSLLFLRPSGGPVKIERYYPLVSNAATVLLRPNT